MTLGLGIGLPAPAAAETRIRFSDFFVGETYQVGVGTTPDFKISPKLLNLHGQRIEIFGFMDGILARDGMFFMILKEPLIGCPFHSIDFDWANFAPVFLKKPTSYFDGPIKITGRLDVGRRHDETGFVSYVRIYDAAVGRAQ
jgi:hypothetical protein